MKQSQELQVAIEAAKESGKILKSYFGKSMKSYHKEGDTIDYVTEADLKVQDKIVEIVKKNFPDHGFLGEEKGLNQNKKYRWIIDPIDGTTNFRNGLSYYAICIALEKDNELILGVINHPFYNNTYWAEKGKGTYKNRKKIMVSQNKNFQDALMAFTFDKKIEPRMKMLKLIGNMVSDFKSLICLQASGMSFPLLAEGKIDAVFDYGEYWDFAAGKIIAEEAGAIVTNWRGKEFKENSGYILATNKDLHKELLKRTRKIIVSM